MKINLRPSFNIYSESNPLQVDSLEYILQELKHKNLSMVRPRRSGKTQLCVEIYNNIKFPYIGIITCNNTMVNYIKSLGPTNVFSYNIDCIPLHSYNFDLIIYDEITKEEVSHMQTRFPFRYFHIWTPR